MTVYESIKENITAALKSGNKERAGLLRLLLAELNNKQKEKFGSELKPLMDEDALAVIQKEAKKRREAIELFKKGNRNDLAEKDEAELKIIEEYLPKQLSREEISTIVEKLATGGDKDFNSLMKAAMAELKGRADGKVVSEVIKNKLSGSGNAAGTGEK
jgi:uncharacterized protein YqeY